MYHLKLVFFMFKYFKGILPEIVDHCLYLNNTIHNFDTRNKHAIVLPYCRLSIKQKHSILYKGAKIWNALGQISKNLNTPK